MTRALIESAERGQFRARAHLPGRTRWDTSVLAGDEYLCAQLEASLLEHAQVTHVVASSVTGRLLVCYDKQVDRSFIERCADAAVVSARAQAARHTDFVVPSVAERRQIERYLRRIRRRAIVVLSLPALIAGLAVGANPLAVAASVAALQLAIKHLMQLLDVGAIGRAEGHGLDRAELGPLLSVIYGSRHALTRATGLAAASVILSVGPFAILALATALVTGALQPAWWLGGASAGWQLFLILSGLCVLVMSVYAGCEYAAQLMWRNAGETMMHRLRLTAYEHVQRTPASFFIDENPGSVLARLGEDINQIEKMFTGVWDFIQITVSLSLACALLVGAAPSFAWFVLLLVPAFVAATRRLRERIAPLYRAVRSESGLLSADIATSLDGLVTIKSFAAEGRVLENVRRRSQRVGELARPAIAVGASFRPVFELVIMSGIVAVAVVAATAAGGFFNFAIYAAVLLLVRELLWPLAQLGTALEMYQRGFASYRRAMSVLSAPTESLEQGAPLALEQVRGELRLEGVRFAYRPEHWIFDGIDVRLTAGRTSAIVGPSGAGKSTLFKLLLRFHQPQYGRVLLDGRDVADLRLDHLRRAISVVSQEVFLFDGSVRENLRFAKPEASEREIEQATRRAELHGFIESLPEGYDTRIGQRGLRLSGGQRQRLALARVLLRDSPIVLLDEATSHVDNQTEAALQGSVTLALQGRTLVVIAHRLSTIADADCIYVIDERRVREQGTHAQLLALNGLYTSLWRLQATAASKRV